MRAKNDHIQQEALPLGAASSLLSKLADNGIIIHRRGDRLHMQPAGAISANLLEEVRANKPALLAALPDVTTREKLVTPAECKFCGGPLAEYILPIITATGPAAALTCTQCYRLNTVPPTRARVFQGFSVLVDELVAMENAMDRPIPQALGAAFEAAIKVKDAQRCLELADQIKMSLSEAKS